MSSFEKQTFFPLFGFLLVVFRQQKKKSLYVWNEVKSLRRNNHINPNLHFFKGLMRLVNTWLCLNNEPFHQLPIPLEVQAASAIAALSNDLLFDLLAAVSGPHSRSSSDGLGPVRNSSASVLLFSTYISSPSQCFCFSASVCPNLFKHYLSVAGNCAWAWSLWVFSLPFRQRECPLSICWYCVGFRRRLQSSLPWGNGSFPVACRLIDAASLRLCGVFTDALADGVRLRRWRWSGEQVDRVPQPHSCFLLCFPSPIWC